jgi:hypothetical protein
MPLLDTREMKFSYHFFMISSGTGNEEENEDRYEKRFCATSGARLVAIATLLFDAAPPGLMALDIVDAVDAGVGSERSAWSGSSARPRNAFWSPCP